MDEASGTNIADSAGSNDGTLGTGTATLAVDGPLTAETSKGIQLAGAQITIPNTAGLNIDGAFAVEFWAAFPSITTSFPFFLLKSFAWNMQVATTSGLRLQSTKYDSSGHIIGALHGQAGVNWRHFVLTGDGSAVPVWYVNGVRQEDMTSITSWPNGNTQTSSLVVGSATGLTLNMANLAIYAKQLTPAQIANHYSTGMLTTGEPTRWTPPPLKDPITINVQYPTQSDLTLTAGQDYIIMMPNGALDSNASDGCLHISGGNNIVIIGGEISVSDQSTANERRGIFVTGYTGTLHVEGVYFHGDDINQAVEVHSDGIVQIVNCRADNIHAHDETSFTDYHAQFIITDDGGGGVETRIDRLTVGTDYQGIQLADLDSKRTRLSHVNITGTDTLLSASKQMIWQGAKSNIVTMEEVYLNSPADKSYPDGQPLDISVHPTSADSDTDRQPVVDADGILSWPIGAANMRGTVKPSTLLPDSTDFVTTSQCGVGYVSPGYVPVPGIARSIASSIAPALAPGEASRI